MLTFIKKRFIIFSLQNLSISKITFDIAISGIFLALALILESVAHIHVGMLHPRIFYTFLLLLMCFILNPFIAFINGVIMITILTFSVIATHSSSGLEQYFWIDYLALFLGINIIFFLKDTNKAWLNALYFSLITLLFFVLRISIIYYLFNVIKFEKKDAITMLLALSTALVEILPSFIFGFVLYPIIKQIYSKYNKSNITW